jgi:hypothetical protein
MYTFLLLLIVIVYVFNIVIHISSKSQIDQNKFDNAIKIMYRQSARWAAASIQDEAPIIKVLHANYAAGYLWAMKDVVSTEEFKRITGEDFLKLESKIVEIQDKATKSLVEKCRGLLYVNEPVLYKAMYLQSE